MKWNKIFRINTTRKTPAKLEPLRKAGKIRIQLTEKEADYLGRLLSSENVSIKGLGELHEIEINEDFANAIREIVAVDLQRGGYFGDDGEPIDKEKVDIVEDLIDKFFVG